VLALLLERVAELACTDTWRNISAALRLVKVAKYDTPHGSYAQTNRPRPEAARVLGALRLPEPGPLVAARGLPPGA
jgi:hypothetical protein